MIYFICIIHLHIFHGNIWTQNWPAPNVSGFIAQLVERRIGIARSRVQAPLKSWIFFRLLYAIVKIAIITARIILHLIWLFFSIANFYWSILFRVVYPRLKWCIVNQHSLRSLFAVNLYATTDITVQLQLRTFLAQPFGLSGRQRQTSFLSVFQCTINVLYLLRP